ncbi:MAG: substrate-binding domain-containing protein [Spirochaetales bacterium]|nr:substrate-binding domain-containing protein [Spirochaetales bacterium]
MKQKSTKKHQSRRFTIGFLGSLFFEAYIYQISEGIVEAAKDYNVNLLCFEGGAVKSPLYFYAQKNTLYDLVSAENIDGIIALSNSIGHFIGVKEINQFFKRFSSLPVVSIGVVLKGKHNIIVDNSMGMRDLLAHFIEKHNSKRIAYICGPKENPDAIQRLDEYRKVLEEYHIPYDPGLIMPGNFSKIAGKEAVSTLIDKRNIDFDTIIGANDYMAISAMEELHIRGIRVPEDVKIGGFDNTKISCGVLPFLTTVEQPMFEMGYQAMGLMVSILTNNKAPETIYLPTRLVVRHSCGCTGPYDIREFNTSIPVLAGTDNSKREKGILTAKKMTQIILNNLEYTITRKISNKKWIEHLIDAFITWIDEQSEDAFMIALERVFLQAVEHGITIPEIYTIVSTLFTIAGNYCDSGLLTCLHNLFNKIIFSLGPITERVFLFLLQKAEERDVTYKKTSLWLISTKGIEELKKFLINEFSELGVKTLYICLFDKNSIDRNYARLLVSYNKDQSLDVDSKAPYFPSRQLIPGGLKKAKERFTLTVFPLFLQNEPLGFFLCDTESLDLIKQETLAGELSSTLKAAEYIEEIRLYSSDLEAKIQERTIELEHAKKKLEEANEQKTQFFINLAHDTKTPLTLIQNYLDNYIKKAGMDTDLNIIKHNITLLINNMTNYLDVEKLKRGQIIYNHNQVVDLSEFIQNRIILFKETARKRNITILETIMPGIFIKADPYAFDRIINNIMDNAIKYTHRRGEILVSLKKENDSVIFCVKDNGTGISRERLNHIFLPYYQLSHKKAGTQGMGMGLFIAKQIATSIGADIRIESEENKGTSVSIITQSHTPADEEMIRNIPYTVPVDYIIHDLEEEELSPDKDNILIVDDNVELLYFFKTSLREEYNVYLACNGKEALRKLEIIPLPDIIISDVMMDGIDGHEFLLTLKKNEDYNTIPFIFLTAKNTIDEKIRGLSEGAIDYIYKPFLLDEVIAKIKTIIQYRIKDRKKNISLLGKRLMETIENISVNKKSTKEYFYFNRMCAEHNITAREMDVLILLAKGLLNKEISYHLKISQRTVTTHVYNIYKKFNVQTRVELMNKFRHLF